MKNSLGRHIILTGFGLWLAAAWMIAVLPERAEADDGAAAYAIELISQIRQYPLAYAEAMGYNRESLLVSLPWLADELSQGLPALEYSDSLTESAAADNSGSGTTTEAGYSTSFARTGKISGAVSFSNFMEPSTAVEIVVYNQFVQELSTDYGGQRCILDGDLSLAGAALDAVTFNRTNAYMLTISLGSARLKTDRQILNQINQLRSNPAGAGAALNLDLSGYVGVYPPLFSNDLLDSFSATPYAADQYFRIHLQNYGYTGYGVGKISTLADFPKSDLNSIAFWLFSSLVVNEVKGMGDSSTIFGPYLNEVGMNLVYMSGDVWDHASLTVIAGLTVDSTPDKDRIYGLIFNDADQNGIYTPGEGRSGRVAKIYRDDTQTLSAVVMTDNTGYFEIELDAGVTYTVVTGSGETLASGVVTLDQDQFFSLKVID